MVAALTPHYKAAGLDIDCKRWGYDGKCAKNKVKRKKAANRNRKTEL